jgi:hypothetical protein
MMNLRVTSGYFKQFQPEIECDRWELNSVPDSPDLSLYLAGGPSRASARLWGDVRRRDAFSRIQIIASAKADRQPE